MFKIVKNLTARNFTRKNDPSRVKYIVIHYFGSLGTAKAVSEYFKTAYRGASAHYNLDEGEIVYQSVEEGDIAWHCGTSGQYYHRECRNTNSLGIEVRPYKLSTKTMNAADNDWYFNDATIERLVELTKYLMKKHNVPIDNVLRHYDVTHKLCPRPFMGNDLNSYHKVSGNEMWKRFKTSLLDEPMLKIGDTVLFKGGPVYTSANAAFTLTNKHASQCKITQVFKGKHPYHCISQDGKGVYGWVDADKVAISTPPAPAKEFVVRVTANALNYRSGPGVQNRINGTIRDKGLYTIVDTQGDWGKLKSGAGWIHLGYTKRI